MAGLERGAVSRPRKNWGCICVVCGTMFEARKTEVKTCSPKCKRELLSRVVEDHTGVKTSFRQYKPRNCEVCGAVYEPSAPNQKTCSIECWRVIDARHRERRKAVKPEPHQTLPLHVAENVCRRLGMSYGAASAEAFNCGLPLSQYLICMADKNGITIYEEGEHDSA